MTCSFQGEIRFWDAKVNKYHENSAFVVAGKFTLDSNQLVCEKYK